MKETRALAILKRLYPEAHWQTISGMAAGGAFDTNSCWLGREIWCELKQANRPKTNRGLVRVTIMKSQPAWQALRQRAGGHTYIALMLASDFYLLPGWCLKELGEGMTLERLNELKLDEKSLFGEQNARNSKRSSLQNQANATPNPMSVEKP